MEASVASWLQALRARFKWRAGGHCTSAGPANQRVMIGARNPEALSQLQKQFAQRKAHKTYLAIVEGHLKQPEAMIDLPIERKTPGAGSV